jgi:hypothetical protein
MPGNKANIIVLLGFLYFGDVTRCQGCHENEAAGPTGGTDGSRVYIVPAAFVLARNSIASVCRQGVWLSGEGFYEYPSGANQYLDDFVMGCVAGLHRDETFTVRNRFPIRVSKIPAVGEGRSYVERAGGRKI